MASAVPPGGPLPRRLGARPRPAARPPSKPVPPPRLSVVIVNFCQWRNTARLVRQLRRSDAFAGGQADVVIVDNHSPSHPVVRKLKRMAGVVVRRFARNHGFARAVNRGCESARGEWVLLLNPDVSVPDGFLDDVLTAADRRTAEAPRVGVIGFQLCNRDGSRQASAGEFPSFWRSLRGLLRRRSRRKCDHRPLVESQPVPWATGGCLLVRRECFDRLRGLDERFFLYYEDVDFCRRARKNGWSVWYDPTVRVTHHWPLHARRVPAPLRLMTRHALLTYARTHWSPRSAQAMAGLVWAEANVRRLWATVRGDTEAAKVHRELSELVGHIRSGRYMDVRRVLRYAAAFLDPIAAEQDGRTE